MYRQGLGAFPYNLLHDPIRRLIHVLAGLPFRLRFRLGWFLHGLSLTWLVPSRKPQNFKLGHYLPEGWVVHLRNSG